MCVRGAGSSLVNPGWGWEFGMTERGTCWERRGPDSREHPGGSRDAGKGSQGDGARGCPGKILW